VFHPSSVSLFYSLIIIGVSGGTRTHNPLGHLIYLLGSRGRIRTDTVWILNPLSLPIGIHGHKVNISIPFLLPFCYT
jgi:hypothetical protein